MSTCVYIYIYIKYVYVNIYIYIYYHDSRESSRDQGVLHYEQSPDHPDP